MNYMLKYLVWYFNSQYLLVSRRTHPALGRAFADFRLTRVFEPALSARFHWHGRIIGWFASCIERPVRWYRLYFEQGSHALQWSAILINGSPAESHRDIRLTLHTRLGAAIARYGAR